jgi:large subunit ribosomal protein L17
MHRHGYKGRKFHRETAQRTALIKSLAEALIIHESIETTHPKAKEIIPYVEKLITKAKKGDLHNRRQIISGLMTLDSAHKLVDEIAPRLQGRDSGHLTIKRTVTRRGDNAQLSRVSFIFDAPKKETAKAETNAEAKVETKAKEVVKKPAAKKKAPAKKPAAKKKAEAK